MQVMVIEEFFFVLQKFLFQSQSQSLNSALDLDKSKGKFNSECRSYTSLLFNFFTFILYEEW